MHLDLLNSSQVALSKSPFCKRQGGKMSNGEVHKLVKFILGAEEFVTGLPLSFHMVSSAIAVVLTI